jgi:hypothetical protein
MIGHKGPRDLTQNCFPDRSEIRGSLRVTGESKNPRNRVRGLLLHRGGNEWKVCLCTSACSHTGSLKRESCSPDATSCGRCVIDRR